MKSRFLRPFAVLAEGIRNAITSSPSEIARRYVNFVTFILAIVLLVIFLTPRANSSSSKASEALSLTGVAIVISRDRKPKASEPSSKEHNLPESTLTIGSNWIQDYFFNAESLSHNQIPQGNLRRQR